MYNEDVNFNIDSFVKESTFETCEINEKISYVSYCAFYGASKCFDFLISNKAKIDSDLVLFAVAGGNVHIIHQCEFLELNFKRKDVLFMAIQFHRNEVCDWLIETKFDDADVVDSIDFIELENFCLNFCNFEMFLKFVEKGFLTSYFCKFIAKYKIKLFYKWMKCCNLFFLIKDELKDHINYLINHYERSENEINEIFKIIVDCIPNWPNDVIDLLKNDQMLNNLLLIYQKYKNS